MDKNLKYELTDEFILVGDKKLFRIKALKDFNDVKAGDLGGLIEKESNLSHDGNCWIYSNARVFGNACVSGNAQVYGDARVFGNAKLFDNAQVYGDAQVFGGAWIYNDAQVFVNAQVYGDAIISGNAVIYNNAQVYGNSQVSGDAVVYDDSWPISPFYVCLSKHKILSCSYTNIKIGCKVHTIEEWKERGEKIGKENGYSDTEIALYTETIELAEKYIELVKSSINND